MVWSGRLSLAFAWPLLLAAAPVSAELPPNNQAYHPLNQMHAPGQAADWAARLQPTFLHFQPVQFSLPTRGTVTLYNTSPDRPVTLDSPSLAGLAVGHTYRIKINEMPEYPGVELYPSIEILGRLHPPAGLEREFPIPVTFTAEEIELALQGRLVTRVVFLEQPQFAIPRRLQQPLPVRTLAAHRNLLAEADRVGRPLLLIRLGGRLPATRGDDAAFFGSGAPVDLLAPPPSPPSSQTTNPQ